MDTYLNSVVTGKLSTFNRLRVLFKSHIQHPDTNCPATICNILLQIKTYYGLDIPITISLKHKSTSIQDNITKESQKFIYKKQNKVLLDRQTNKGRSNLFGWHIVDDAPIVDKYASQPAMNRYKRDIVALDDMDNFIVVRELRVLDTQYVNVCKDTSLTEQFISYELKLDSACTVYINQFYLAGTTSSVPTTSSPYKKTNIVLECEFNEESKVIQSKLDKLAKYISDINYIINAETS